MSLEEKRKQLAEWILSSDEATLNKVEEVRAAYDTASHEEIVAVTVQGQPLTKKQYIARIDEARAQFKRGESITTEELIKEMKTW